MTEIRTTLAALVTAQDALQKLAAQKLDPKPRYHVAKLVTLVRPELQHFQQERDALIRELGVSRDPTELERTQRGPEPVYEVALASDRWPEFQRRMTTLGEVEVTLPWGPVTAAMVETCAEITANDLVGLGPLFVLDERDVT